jgi:hypothetical protein
MAGRWRVKSRLLTKQGTGLSAGGIATGRTETISHHPASIHVRNHDVDAEEQRGEEKEMFWMQMFHE